jgi:hypothetical protein
MKSMNIAPLLFLLAFAGSAADGVVSLRGEIVDMHCYISRGAHGAEHAGCGNACINRDVPAGLLAEDGTLYLLVNEKPVSVKEKVAGKAGQKVVATGKILERNGTKAFQLVSIE